MALSSKISKENLEDTYDIVYTINQGIGRFHGDLRSQDVRIFPGLGMWGWAGRKKKKESKLRSERGLWSLFFWGINPAGFVSPTTEVRGDLMQSKRPEPHLPTAA